MTRAGRRREGDFACRKPAVVRAGAGSLASVPRPPTHPNVRRSPYFAETERAGCSEYMVYNHMYMPIAYGRDPEVDYRALTEAVTLWDVGAERQTELRGPGALRLADYLCTRDLSSLATGKCRYTLVCDERGQIITEPIVLRPWPDVVWISHGDTDLTLWAAAIAAHGGFDVRVTEPDVAPLQVQGPKSRDMLAAVTDAVEGLEPFSCRVGQVAGVEAVVSRTGWSRELGYEIYPLSSDRALELWAALLAAGEPHGLLVTGPNLNRAVEQGITDTHYAVNSGMNPFEAGSGRFVDLDAADFIGRDALRQAQKEIRRHTLGLVVEQGELPRMETFWRVRDERGEAGVVRWAAHSYALGKDAAIALLDVRVEPGDAVTIDHERGSTAAVAAELPLVEMIDR
jgi:glycine cleavage system aminomethyltransferase T